MCARTALANCPCIALDELLHTGGIDGVDVNVSFATSATERAAPFCHVPEAFAAARGSTVSPA
jgi:hypothetical protein